MSEPKQVIVMRKDLNMRKGKMCAQTAHASMQFLLDAISVYDVFGETSKLCRIDVDRTFDKWVECGYPKIVVGVNSIDELMDVYWRARDEGLLVSLIKDHGRTEFHGKETVTCCAIGPNYPEVIDPITSHLKLL
jgi:PTH2 family peptidyl-tRNA hydrolase